MLDYYHNVMLISIRFTNKISIIKLLGNNLKISISLKKKRLLIQYYL